MHYFKTMKTNLMFSGALKANFFFFFLMYEVVLPGAKIYCVLVAIKTAWHRGIPWCSHSLRSGQRSHKKKKKEERKTGC